MGTTKNGLLRGVSGQVGPVVVVNDINRSIVRIMPKESSKPPKLSQLDTRAKFLVVSKFVTAAKKVLQIGYQYYDQRVKPLNAAIAYHLDNALTGIYPNYKIDPAKVVVSKAFGDLQPQNIEISAVAGGLINVVWNPAEGFADPGEVMDRGLDKAVFLAYNETKQLTLTLLGITRESGKLSAKAPRIFVGDKLHVYFFFATDDGQVSPSTYLGSITPLT